MTRRNQHGAERLCIPATEPHVSKILRGSTCRKPDSGQTDRVEALIILMPLSDEVSMYSFIRLTIFSVLTISELALDIKAENSHIVKPNLEVAFLSGLKVFPGAPHVGDKITFEVAVEVMDGTAPLICRGAQSIGVVTQVIPQVGYDSFVGKSPVRQTYYRLRIRPQPVPLTITGTVALRANLDAPFENEITLFTQDDESHLVPSRVVPSRVRMYTADEIVVSDETYSQRKLLEERVVGSRSTRPPIPLLSYTSIPELSCARASTEIAGERNP